MPSIQLTDNSSLDLSVSSADGNATLNRYLMNPLKLVTPAGLASIANQKVADLDAKGFPMAASAGAAGDFAVEGTTFNVGLQATASIDLLKGDDMDDFLQSMQVTPDPSAAALVSFGLTGTVEAGDTGTAGDFTLGISKNASVSLTSYCNATASETAADAFRSAIAALTIPHDLADLNSLPPNTVCEIEAVSSLQFSASVSYSFLNDPLATKTIPNLPSLTLNASASATLEGTATRTGAHKVTIAKLPNGMVHLAVSLKKTDDFETSLTVSAGVQGEVGSYDALAFLLGLISPNSTAEMAQIRADLPDQAQGITGDVKAALDAVLASSLQVSLKAALDASESQNRIFLYEINMGGLDETSTGAIEAALRGDFTAITRVGASLAGVRILDSALVTTSRVAHSLAVHLLGIFNWGSTSEFVKQSKVDYTRDTHEIVLSDEAIEVATNNLAAEKLREVVVKGITLTLPASASTPQAKTPLAMMFFDRQASTNTSAMRQFVNVVQAAGASNSAAAQSLLGGNLKDYGDCSLYVGLRLTPAQTRQLFVNAGGQPIARMDYIQSACSAQAIILAGDSSNAARLPLFTAGVAFWQQIADLGQADAVNQLLARRGIPPNAYADVLDLLWWSSAMTAYGDALVHGKSLEGPGKDVVKKAGLGFHEPWLVLAAWTILGRPALDCMFTSSLLRPGGAVQAAKS